MADTTTDRTHRYFAEATALEAEFSLPLRSTLEPQGLISLGREGGYLTQDHEAFKLENVISYQSAYTQVAGNPDPKTGHGWSTLATSVIEGFNLLDVLTCDRIVSQVATEHPLQGYVPKVTFLGSRFDNLRIAGHRVELVLNPDMLGGKPDNDEPYGKDANFISRLQAHYGSISVSSSLPTTLTGRYNRVPPSSGNPETLECSLVNQATGSFPGRSFGHVIQVPDFGTISLAVVRVDQVNYVGNTPTETLIQLTMLEVELGCIAAGKVAGGTSKTNGATAP